VTARTVRAVGFGNLILARLLLRAGVRVDESDRGDANGPSALFYAIGIQNAELVSELLAAGANPNLRSGPGA